MKEKMDAEEMKEKMDAEGLGEDGNKLYRVNLVK